MSEAVTGAAFSTSSWQSCDCSPVPHRRRRQRRTRSGWHSYSIRRQHLWAKQGNRGPAAELLCPSQHSLTGLAHLGMSLPARAQAGTAVGRGWPSLLSSSTAPALLGLAPTALPREQPVSWHNRGPPAMGHGKLVSMLILGACGCQTPASGISSACGLV